MTDQHDRSDNGAGTFLMGVLAGAVVGAALGLLFAPKAGAELREELSDRADALAKQARKSYRKASKNTAQLVEMGKETAAEWAERSKDMYSQAREAVSRGVDEVKKA